MTYDKRLQAFKDYISKIEYQKYTLNSLIYWDKITNMPEGSVEYRAKVMAYMGEELYNMLSNNWFLSELDYFSGNEKNDQITDAMVRRIRESSAELNKIPKDEYRQYHEVIGKSDVVWERAKHENNFELIRPYYEKIFDYFKNFAEYWGYEKDPYDALMNYYVDGMTVETMDRLIGEVKPFLVDALAKIKACGKQDYGNAAKCAGISGQAQKRIWKKCLEELEFDFNCGRVDIGEHPTMLANSPFDVRIVNNFKENDFYFGLFNILHSGGKGIYHQRVDQKLLGTLLAEPPSFAFEEFIGRFYENVIGRSEEFWNFAAKVINNELGGEILDANECYRYVNRVNGSQIRLEADEITYLLHVIIRYEMEKDVINGRLEVKDMPEVWNQKCLEYLGSEPVNDSEGILQDIHWAAGYVGYFPTYIMATLASAQLVGVLEKNCDIKWSDYTHGDYIKVISWLSDNIFRQGALYQSTELFVMATGGNVSPEPYIRYLRNKYSDVYNLNL